MPPPERRAVLVTGGAGYIGAQAVLALRDRGRRVVVIDDLSTGFREAVPADVPFCEGDAGDGALLARAVADHGVDAVMHFAASISAPDSVADPARYYRNNTGVSLALAAACLDAGISSFIFSSSATVYGLVSASPIAEDAPTRPLSPYGASKLMTEAMLADMAAAHPGFRTVSLRYFNVAGADPLGRGGPRNARAGNLIPLAIDSVLGLRGPLDITGDDYDTRDGTGERDYIHVADLAQAHLAALDYLDAGGPPTVLNCGYGRGATVLEVIAGLEALLGRPVPTRRAPRRPGDAASSVADVRRLRATLDWSPQYDDLGAILASALAWRRRGLR